jgi:CBS-domain-containing membrane protein
MPAAKELAIHTVYCRRRMSKRDLFLAPTLEAALVMVVALAGWASHQPMIFASLGPTAFEMIETPKRPSARPYNIIMGNVIAVLASFFALWVTRAWFVPAVSASGVPWLRVWSATLAALLTVLVTLLARATQPAALSTVLLISLGIMQTWKDGGIILAAVVLMTVLGEPVRHWRAKNAPPNSN